MPVSYIFFTPLELIILIGIAVLANAARKLFSKHHH